MFSQPILGIWANVFSHICTLQCFPQSSENLLCPTLWTAWGSLIRLIPPRFLGRFASSFLSLVVFSFHNLDASAIFPEKNFSQILSDVNGHEHVFIDRIRKRHWYNLVYDNTDVDVFYFLDLVWKYYTGIDTDMIDLDQNKFLVHLVNRNFLITVERIQEVTQISIPPQHTSLLALIDYMPLMGVWCAELDCGL